MQDCKAPQRRPAKGVYYNYGMIELSIPGRGEIRLEHLVCDVNGTLALDGVLISGVAERIAALRQHLTVHLITANTHGNQALIDQRLGLHAEILAAGGEAEQKAAFVRQLGAESVVALGQGANDARMLAEAAIGICVLSAEGTYGPSLLAADVIAPGILTALDLLAFPRRLVATLRT